MPRRNFLGFVFTTSLTVACLLLLSGLAALGFAADAFALPPFGSFGDAGRNILEGPGFKNMNLALHKLVRFTDDTHVQVRIKIFHLFNHVNLGLPDGFFGSPTFGQILSAGSARRV